MAEKPPGKPTKASQTNTPRWARYAISGGIAGLLSAIAVLFIITIYYGETLGMGAERCLIFGCAMTTLLSQPAGLIGIVVGIIIGVLSGYLGHHVTR
jgi:hypothetical protein